MKADANAVPGCEGEGEREARKGGGGVMVGGGTQHRWIGVALFDDMMRQCRPSPDSSMIHQRPRSPPPHIPTSPHPQSTSVPDSRCRGRRFGRVPLLEPMDARVRRFPHLLGWTAVRGERLWEKLAEMPFPDVDGSHPGGLGGLGHGKGGRRKL